jgi:hypothetical protein
VSINVRKRPCHSLNDVIQNAFDWVGALFTGLRSRPASNRLSAVQDAEICDTLRETLPLWLRR